MATIKSSTPPATDAIAERSPVLQQALWVLAAAPVGFATSALFTSVLRLPRPLFIATHVLITSLFLYAYLRASPIELPAFLRHNWIRGLVGAVVVGILMAWSMERQPASIAPEGLGLVRAFAWLGLVYGLVDSLLLNVLPVLATWRAFEARGWMDSLPGRVAAGATGLASSLIVTAAYHLGFAEFRGPGLIGPLIGNGIITVGYVLAGNPVTAVVAHVVLHVGSVLHGIDTTVTLPPHY